MRLGVLVSGRGSNLEAVLEAVADARLPALQPGLVISNRAGVRALDVAARHGVPWVVLEARAFASRADRDAAIGRALTDAGVRLALLAGYDEILRATYFAAYSGRTINIHPSLLPAHGGRGMIGLAVHEAVLAAGDAETGVSIHEVTPELDAGPLLAQRRVAVVRGQPAAGLAGRVLVEEHRLLVDTLAGLSADG
ncbi:MAG: phosphoribosylglycinamide formyltransferase [Chloroflexota bacterium]|nr:phosphoribosylglycinamide formyltransferase [Chloroflexota bacterium]